MKALQRVGRHAAPCLFRRHSHSLRLCVSLIATAASCIAFQADAPAVEPAARFWNFRVSDLAMLVVVLGAPFGALWAQSRLQQRKEERSRRLWMFKTLMATRATVINTDHVQALNMIDVEFCSDNPTDRNIRSAWKAYLDHLTTHRPEDTRASAWDERSKDLLAELLNKMGGPLGYNFDFTYVKDRAYHPKGLLDRELDLLAMTRLWVDVLSGQRSLPMHITGFPTPQPRPTGADGNDPQRRLTADTDEVVRLKVQCITSIYGLRFVLSQPTRRPEDVSALMYELNKVVILYADDADVRDKLRAYMQNGSSSNLITLIKSMCRSVSINGDALTNDDIERVFIVPLEGTPTQVRSQT